MCTVVNKRFEAFDVYIGRGSRWGNEYSHREGTKATVIVPTVEEAIAKYRDDLWSKIKSGQITLSDLRSLDGKRLGCFCKPAPCHGDVLKRAVEWARTYDGGR